MNAKTAPDGLVGIYLADTFDNLTLVAEYPEGIYVEPIPFAARKRPPIIPDRSVKGKKTCSVHIADIYNGPGLAGVPRGTAKKLRVFSYHFNYHKTGGHSKTGLDRVESGWDIKRMAEPAAFASMRVQAQCMAMGQAAGTLAAFMPGKDVRQLDFVAVRRLCERQGAITK